MNKCLKFCFMKACPNCQSQYPDDSLQFCLQCGTPLSKPEQPHRPGGNGIIIAAILSGFILLALVVGGTGIYLFSRPDNTVQNNAANSQNTQNTSNEKILTQNNQIPVEQLNGNKLSAPFPTSSVNSAKTVNQSNNTPPRIIASASSVRKSDDGNFYFPNFAFDNNPVTAWCEGAPGAGIGEWLQFNFDREVLLKQIKIQPGYFKNDKVWAKNNRLAKISVKFSDNSTREFSLRDERKSQTLDVGRMSTNSVKITIEDYFAGASDSNDTLISEVSFVTEP